MDTKVTLHFDKQVIENAKEFTKANNISLSHLTEYLYRNITTGNYKTLEELPISSWVSQIAEDQAEYKQRSRQGAKMHISSQNNAGIC